MLYDYRQQSYRLLCCWPEDHRTRPNEAAIAPDGSLWFSTMDKTAQLAIGSWYRFTYGSVQAERMLSGQHVPNTLVWHGKHAWPILFAIVFVAVMRSESAKARSMNGRSPH